MLLFGLFSFGQTPQIMHKMCGGTKSNFVQTMQDSDALIRQTNFGLPPTIYVKKAVIDSIIALNDSMVIVVTSHKVVEDFEFNYVYSEEDSSFVCSDSMMQKSLTYDKTGDWQPGRDTLIHHSVFNAKHKCNYILDRLNYEFGVRTYRGHEVVFVGFDCSKAPNKEKRNIVPPFWFSSPFDPNSWMIVVALFSLVYFVVLRKRKAVLSF